MKKILILMLAATFNFYAQSEFQVNTFQDSVQRAPVIAQKGDGSYLIVWQSINEVESNSKFDIFSQWFDSNDQKFGERLPVNLIYENDQERPAVAMNDAGSYVIVWATHSGTEQDIFDIKGYAHTENLTSRLDVNSTTIHTQTKPDVAIDQDGNFIVVWESWYQDGSNKGIYGQRYNSELIKVGSEFLINTTTLYSQANPTVEYLENGNFVVVWESWKQDIITPSGYGLYGKIFDSDANVVAEEFTVNTYTNDFQWFGDIAPLSDGGFVVAWCSWEQDGDDGGIYVQKFENDGSFCLSCPEQLVNKTTVNYQWLPKVSEMPDGKIGIVWSSWRQDGSREGVYAKILNADLTPSTFETQVNSYTDSYQWEPDFVPTGVDEMLVTWSSWGQVDNDYEVMAKRIKLTGPEAALSTSSYNHIEGISSSRFFVHVMDSTQLNGNEYELSFNVVDENNASASIYNLTNSTDVLTSFPINGGEGIFYLTPVFDGVALEIQPNFSFKIDDEGSFFENVTGSNLTFTYGQGLGSTELAPIDIKLVWGNSETDSDGNYLLPLDSAYNTTGQKVVKCPFYAWNITDNEKMDLVILEPAQSENLRWDNSEAIGVLTPPQYATAFPRYHVGINVSAPADAVLPGEGDVNYIFTKRPLTSDDKFTFTTNKAFITTDVKNSSINPNDFSLEQNYPNPFNPNTTIKYSIPSDGMVKIVVYNLLGEKITELVNADKKSGSYKVTFNANKYSSGVYFYSILHSNKSITKKMLLIK
jgi:hypothetical protein